MERWVGVIFMAMLAYGCGKSAGTYVHVKFEGETSSHASIARLDLEITLAGKHTTTFFNKKGAINLPTDATLEIAAGEGPLDIIAEARSASGQLLGKGHGSHIVKRGTTVIVKVILTPAGEPYDGGITIDTSGYDGSSSSDHPALSDTLPTLDYRPLQGGAISDSGRELPGSGGTIGNADSLPGQDGANEKATFVFNPEKLDLGTAAIGSKTQPQSITLTNSGLNESGPLSFSLQNPEAFAFDNNSCAGISLLPNASCTFSILFKPLTPGTVESTLTISAPATSSPKIPLFGTGLGAGTASFNLSPMPKDFGVVDINGGKVSTTFTVTNTGSLTIGPVKVFFETGAPFYKIINDRCQTQYLTPGKTCTFDVTFAPTAIGPAHVNLVVRAEPGASATTPLSGIGRQVFNLVVQMSGNGAGTIKAPGLVCASKTCKTTVEWSLPSVTPQLLLEAIPETGSVFGGYLNGPCEATPRCTIHFTSDVSMGARFNANPTQNVQLGLNIISLAGHQGVLVVSDGVQTSVCENSHCGPETRTLNTSLTITAKPKAAFTFAGWTDGPCKGTHPTCTISLTADTFISATFGPQSYVFTSSTAMVPNGFGGVTGADAECQRLADKASLPGKYHAWLSSLTEPARTRVGNGGWIRTDGRPFSASLARLLDNASPVVFYPARLDEWGQDLGNKNQWVATGSDTDGNPTLYNCQDFKGTQGEINLGNTAMGSRAWSFFAPRGSCTSRYRLLCFRTDLDASGITPPTLPGRRIFVTKGPFISGGGSVAADESCQAEAKAANLEGRFIAFISTGTFSAQSRISQGHPWKRLDEVFVARIPDDFANGNLLAPIGVAANGIYLNKTVWTGTKNPGQIAAEDTSCQSFNSSLNSQQGIVGMSDSTVTPDWFAFSNMSCDQPDTHLICIEP